jgi:hypothetical protein
MKRNLVERSFEVMYSIFFGWPALSLEMFAHVPLASPCDAASIYPF